MTGWSISTAARLSRRHLLQLPLLLVTPACARQSAPPGRPSQAGRRCVSIWSAPITEHTLYDDWWRERSAFERLGDIKVPCCRSGLGKMGLHLRGNILGFEQVKAPKKLVVTGGRTISKRTTVRPDRIPRKELLPFYEAHLKASTTVSWTARRCACSSAAQTCGARAGMAARARPYVPYYLRKGPQERDLAQ